MKFAVVVEIGGRSKRWLDSAKNLPHGIVRGKLFGMSEYYGPKNGSLTGCKVFIYSRQSKRELADTFFHEMTHIFLQMIGGVRKQKDAEEALCRWIGYMAKILLADYDSCKYGRGQSRRG